jgi:hypothetical protein
MQKNTKRNQKNLVLHNFLIASVPYIDIATLHYDGLVQILAFCARNLYEIHLQSRCVQINEVHLQRWAAEAATDNIEILEGLIAIDPNNTVGQHAILKEEIDRKEKLLKKHSLERKKPRSISDIAKDMGKEAEHKSIFKMFSKLLHPTSYLVNSSPAEIQNNETRNTLIIHIQLYAWDIIGCIRQSIGFPSS